MLFSNTYTACKKCDANCFHCECEGANSAGVYIVHERVQYRPLHSLLSRWSRVLSVSVMAGMLYDGTLSLDARRTSTLSQSQWWCMLALSCPLYSVSVIELAVIACRNNTVLNSVSDPDPYWIRIAWSSGSGSILRIRNGFRFFRNSKNVKLA